MSARSDLLGRTVPIAVGQWRPWLPALGVLGMALVAMGIMFTTEVLAAVRTWDRSSAYNHCWLVLPVAGWLAWTRQEGLAGVAPTPIPLVAILALAGAMVWLVMERLGVMEGRQFAALGLIWVLALAVLGWRVCAAMAAPLAYLVFLVPFGEFATPWLQDVTLWMIVLGLRALDITHHVDGLLIEIPAGAFLVAEACAGLRFLIASLAFGALYALVMFRSPGRRVLVMVLAFVVPLVANGFRALGIVLLGHHLGSAEAAAVDHVVYGWVFFSLVLVLLTLAGLPFRQDGAGQASLAAAVPLHPIPRIHGRGLSRLVLAAGLTLGLASIGPLIAAGLETGASRPAEEAVALTAPAGCQTQGMALRCGDYLVNARLVTFEPGGTWTKVATSRRRALGEADDEAFIFAVRTPSMQWQGRQSAEQGGLVAAGAWLGGQPVGDGLRTRATHAWQALWGMGSLPVLVIVTLLPIADGAAHDASRMEERRIMQAVLAAQEAGLASLAAQRSLRP